MHVPMLPHAIALSVALLASTGLPQAPPLVPLPELNLFPEPEPPKLPPDVQAAREEALLLLQELYVVLRAALLHEPNRARIIEVERTRRDLSRARRAVAEEPSTERLDRLRKAIKKGRKLLRSWYVIARSQKPSHHRA